MKWIPTLRTPWKATSDHATADEHTKEGRNVVVCNDIPGFLEAVLEERDMDKDDVKMMKVGIDGGRGTLKVCATLIYNDDDTNEETCSNYSHRGAPQPKRALYKEPLTTGATFNDDGVRRVLILAGRNAVPFKFC